MYVPFSEHIARLLLKAVARLLAVPNGARQRKLATHSILAHGAQRSPLYIFSFEIVRRQPQLLQLRVILRYEMIILEYFVQVTKAPLMKGNNGLCLEDTLVLV